MSQLEAFKKFYPEMVKLLPMDDILFTAELFSKGLLPGDTKEMVKSLPTRASKAAHFLDNVIKPVNTDCSFKILLDIMEISDNIAVKELASQVRQKCVDQGVCIYVVK